MRALGCDEVLDPRMVTVPDWAPPFDDQRSGQADPAEAVLRFPGSPPGAGTLPRPEARTGAQPLTSAQTLTGACALPAAQARTGPQPLTGAQAPEWPQWFAQILAEALAGQRPRGQLGAWLSARARSQFARLAPAFAAGGRPGQSRPRIVRVIATQPASGVIEMSVIASFGPRTRALALRLENPAQVSANAPRTREASRSREASRTHDAPGSHNAPGRRAAGGIAGWICTEIEAA